MRNIKGSPILGRRRPLLFGSLLAATLLGAVGASHAQNADGAVIDLNAEIQAPAGGEIGLPMFIQTPRGGAGNLIMVLRGLPSDVTVSEGRAFGQGVWAVPLASASRLKIKPAASAGGVSEITVELVTREGAKLATAVTLLRIIPQAAGQPIQIPGQQQTASVQPRVVGRPDTSQNTATPARLSPNEEEELGRLILKGNNNMQTGKVAAARLLYQRAAESGLAEGALALAGTYDAKELVKWNIVGGVHADAKLARQWYGKAKDMGSQEASRRLQQFE
jgi:hypothetical protein